MKNPIIVLTGPTASGKTALSLELARKFHGEIICADSMTVYRGMDIGTDKPTRQLPMSNDQLPERNSDSSYTIGGIRHHLLDILNPDQEYNVSIFCDLVEEKIGAIRGRGHVPFIVGGSLLYIDTFAYDYALPPVEPDFGLRQELEEKTPEQLWEQLVILDPEAEWTIDRHNKRRIVRALEVCLKTGEPFSKQKSRKELKNNVLYLAMEEEREQLYRNINERVDQMMSAGFLAEARRLNQKYDQNTAMQAAGYRQLAEYLDGKTTLPKAIENTKQAHRNYAKKQLTWLRRNPDKIIVHSFAEAQKLITGFLK
jgi:tRNA dimethylallyltransferase